ncbi:MAG TPA: c-type cytochrome [Terriglobales bacterium]|nr:c-type cytochrome [Terriglobales bacterium]
MMKIKMKTAISKMRSQSWKLVLFVAAAWLAAIAAGQNLTYRQDPNWQPPQAAAARSNPLAQNSGAAGGGRKLFLRECSECHGQEGSGRKRAADLLLPQVQKQSDGALFWKITNGNDRHGMPSFSRLPELQRWQLVLYLRQLPVSASTASPAQRE